ncbi:uncharacterized protein At4g06744-like [Malania oleifera]|uniref:uncharacterized protein At4g06744-like n=1 Tax=Malania oleifera TaxID=397392 RepID=UPI0025ADF56A|nr:uncharacterized protein At4g06744-like [Malania oleifera]
MSTSPQFLFLLVTTFFLQYSSHVDATENNTIDCACTAPPPPPPAPGCLSESEAVLEGTRTLLKNISYDPNNYTKSWVGDNYCNFKGYYCDIVPDRRITGLAGIDFNGASFGGVNTLDVGPYIQNLPDIAIFHANSNNLSGTIPLTISRLRYLYELDVSNNRFTGGFPAAILSATKLTFLDLRYNSFSGTIPPQLFNLNLDVLFLNNNKFGGGIPDTLGNTSAVYVTFANNGFTGQIPGSIGLARNLREVLFLNNQLSGCLPYEVGLLGKATVFDVESNQLTGPIPHSFGCLAEMGQLNLAGNQFYGTVPESVCMLGKLYKLSLSNNYFTQVGRHCRRLIAEKVMDVRMNCILDLPEQRSKAECAAFFSKRRYCPLEQTFTIVPCTLPPPLRNGSSAVLAGKRAVAPSPITYAALERNHR